MGYLTYAAYYNNDPSVLFRGVNQNGDICGDKNNANTKNLPYLYFYGPADTLSTTKTCVDVCPYYDGSAITVPTSFPSAAYTKTFSPDGTAITGAAPIAVGDIVGYDSYSILGRICVPNAKMFTTLIDASKFSSAFSQG
jgi:hypothetical protein